MRLFFFRSAPVDLLSVEVQYHRRARLAMDEALYNGILAALEAVHGGQTANEVRQSC